LLNLPSIILVLIFVNVKTLIMLMLFSEQACGHHVGDPWCRSFLSSMLCTKTKNCTCTFLLYKI